MKTLQDVSPLFRITRPIAFLTALSLPMLMVGCTSLPSFESSNQSNEQISPSVSDLVTHIQCEIKEVIEDPNPAFDVLRSYIYVANANLTLDVVDNQAFSPSVSLIKSLSASANRTLSITGQLAGTQHRNINLVFTLDLNPQKIAEDRANDCVRPLGNPNGLRGNLGIREIVSSGLRYAVSEDFIFPFPIPTDAAGKRLNSPAFAATFGSTIEFTIVRGIGGSPTVTQTDFKGPAANSSLLNFTRTAKDTLVISFASAGPRNVKPQPGIDVHPSFIRPAVPMGSADIEQAAKAAQDNTTRMILQRLLIP
jgi:hypothetical protein